MTSTSLCVVKAFARLLPGRREVAGSIPTKCILHYNKWLRMTGYDLRPGPHSFANGKIEQ